MNDILGIGIRIFFLHWRFSGNIIIIIVIVIASRRKDKKDIEILKIYNFIENI